MVYAVFPTRYWPAKYARFGVTLLSTNASPVAVVPFYVSPVSIFELERLRPGPWAAPKRQRPPEGGLNNALADLSSPARGPRSPEDSTGISQPTHRNYGSA